MSIVAPERPAFEPPAREHSRVRMLPPAPPRRTLRTLLAERPGWPLTSYLLLYPLWWLLGIDQLLIIGVAALMAAELLRMDAVRLPRGFGWWLVFLAWAAAGVLVLQVDAPGALPGGSATRYLTFTYRLLLYLAGTVFGLYLYNCARLTTQRIVRAFSWLFVTVVAGGVLGTVAPHLHLRSGLELVLPRSVTRIQFVHDLIHPIVAQLNVKGGVVYPRASAPFAYTNTWGLAIAFLLPFFVLAWLGPAAGRRRHYAPLVLLVAVYPIVMSQNRGLWLSLAAIGVFLCVRALAAGRLRFVGWFVAAAVLAVAVVAVTPLSNTIEHRLSNPGSVNGRSSLSAQTIDSVSRKSPVFGLGTTRDVQGSFYSIAGGDNPSCSGCTPPPLGTQGQFWTLAYTTGFGGLLLYLVFVLLQFFGHVRSRSRITTLGLSVLLVHLTTMFVYDALGFGLCVLFPAMALMWRERDAERAQVGLDPDARTLGEYAHFVRANGLAVGLSVLVGVAGGAVFRVVHGTSYSAQATILLPSDPEFDEVAARAQTLDTIAQFADSPQTVDAVRSAVGQRIRTGDGTVWVTATANTRLLHVHFTAASPLRAREGANAAAVALIAVRHTSLSQLQSDAVAIVTAERKAVLAAVADLDALRRAQPALTGPLRKQRAALATRADKDYARIQALAAVEVAPGTVVDTSAAVPSSGTDVIALGSGALLGLLAGVCLALVLRARGSPTGRSHFAAGSLLVVRLCDETLPTTKASRERPGRTRGEAGALFGALGVGTALSADGSVEACATTALLQRELDVRGGGVAARPHAVVVVATARGRRRTLDQLCTRLRHAGVTVAGVALVGAGCAPRPGGDGDNLDSESAEATGEIRR